MAPDLNIIQQSDINTPEDLFNFAKNELIIAVKKSKHPFHLCTLSTINLNGEPELRTVVSRGLDDKLNQLRIHSDQRSQKNKHIKQNAAVSVLFYSVPQKLQVRLTGYAELFEEGDQNTNHFANSTPNAQICYAFPVDPGTPIDQPKKEQLFKEINPNQIDYLKPQALENFSHILINFNTCDILWLNNRGHVRILAEYINENWQSKFIVA